MLAAGGLAGLGALLAACGGAGSSTAPGTSAGASSSAPSGPSAAPSSAAPPAGTATLDDATRARLDQLFDQSLTSSGVAGMAAAVTLAGQEWARTGGVADLTTREPYSAAGHVRIASITKSFTGTAVLQLVDQGALALSDPLARFVPGVANGDRITVEDMLGMRSGIYDFTADDQFDAAFAADPTMSFSQAQVLEIIARHQPAFAPGEKVEYADSNFWLLGSVLEAVTGSPRDRVLTEQVVDRLALPATSYPTGASIPDPHPTGYVPPVTDDASAQSFDNTARPPAVVDEVDPRVAGTAGAMISTLADLQVWGRELGEGTLLRPETQAARLAASRRLEGQQLNLGYGLGVVTLNEFLGHDGAIFGFSTLVLRRPQTDCTIVLTANESTNSTTPTFLAGLGIVQALYPDQVR